MSDWLVPKQMRSPLSDVTVNIMLRQMYRSHKQYAAFPAKITIPPKTAEKLKNIKQDLRYAHSRKLTDS